MRKQKEDFVTRAKFEELQSVVRGHTDSIISLMEDRYLLTADPASRLSQRLRKERGITGKAEKGAVLKMVPK
jgi:hypothetical protein